MQDANNLIAGITYLQSLVRAKEPQLADALCAAVAHYADDQREVFNLRSRLSQIAENRHIQSFNAPINMGWLADYSAHIKEELAAEAFRAFVTTRNASAAAWTSATLGAVLEGWGRLVSGGDPAPTPGQAAPTPGQAPSAPLAAQGSGSPS